MADMTSLLAFLPESNAFHTPFKIELLDLDFGDSDNAAMLATGTHNVFTIEQGKALLGAYGVVEDAVTSGGSATVQFKVGSDTLTGALPVANLAAGDSFTIATGSVTGTTSVASYAKSAADTLDIAVATAALTAGRILVYLIVADVEAAVDGKIAYDTPLQS